MKEKLGRFMQGRYGNDQLNKLLMILVMVCLALSFFAGNVFYLIGLFFLCYIYFRMFSKNINKRYGENEAYLRQYNKIRNFFQSQKGRMLQRKTNHIYKCPTCKQKIRIPRGKGKVAVRCPKCGMEFLKKS